MKLPNTAYKVLLRADNGVLMSAGHGLEDLGLRMVYPENKIVRPVNGRMFVFQDLFAARHFAFGRHNCEIWEVACSEMRRIAIGMPVWGGKNVKDMMVYFKDFWRTFEQYSNQYNMFNRSFTSNGIPDKTYGVRHLKLVKQVPFDKI